MSGNLWSERPIPWIIARPFRNELEYHYAGNLSGSARENPERGSSPQDVDPLSAVSEFLPRVPYFAGLDPAEIEEISGLVFERSAERGTSIVLEGSRSDALFFVRAGAVKCFKTSPEGKEQILRIVLPWDSFNDAAVFDGGASPEGAEAMSPVILYGITRANMDRILIAHPLVLLNALKVLSARIRHTLQLVEDLSFRHVINRIARVLLDYAGDGSGPRPKLTQQEIASIVGTAREVVGRSLKTLQQEGVIRMERNRLVIVNREGLRQMAGSSG